MLYVEKKQKITKEGLNFFSTLSFIDQFLDKLHLQLVLFYFGWLVDTVLEIVAPILFGIMINQMVYYRNLSSFIQISLLFFGVSIFSCLLYFLLYEMYELFWNALIYRMRLRMFHRVLKMDTESMVNAKYGDISNLIQWNVMESVHFVVRNLIHNINNYIRIVVCFVIAFIIDPWIALVLAVMVPVSVYVSWRLGKKVRSASATNQETYGKYVSWLYEIMNALKDVRMLGAQKRVNRIFHQYQDEMIQADIRERKASLKAKHLIANANTWIQMLLFSVFAYLACYKNLSIGSVIVVLTYFGILTDSLSEVSSKYLDAQNRISIIQRLKDLMETPTVDSWTGKEELNVTNGELEFADISFAYQGHPPVIRNLDLQIKAGEKVALVGESGCGKTTLSYMLLGFYLPGSGSIRIDQKDISECSLESIRKNIGVVQQEVLIFDGTIRYNIMLGNEAATEDEFIRVCRAAGVYDFVMEMEEQFDTVIGRKGRQLSGGQKQRIAIARIYLKNPSILVFDEATASLDHETEQQIHESWKKVLEGRTAIVIAHRLSSVMLCDRAVILQNGHIAESGKPEILREKSEAFRTLFALNEEVAGC